jgi:hypothetical protein
MGKSHWSFKDLNASSPFACISVITIELE